MDIETRNELIDICILSLLKKEGCYGYYILKSVRDYAEDMSEQVLYCILKRLEASDMISSYSMEYNNRLRKYYSLTELGTNHVNKFLNKWREIADAYNFVTQDRSEKKRRWLS